MRTSLLLIHPCAESITPWHPSIMEASSKHFSPWAGPDFSLLCHMFPEGVKSENEIQNEIFSKQNEKETKKFEIENQNEILSKNFEIVSKQKDIESNHFEFNLKFVEEISNEENIYEISLLERT